MNALPEIEVADPQDQDARITLLERYVELAEARLLGGR